MVLNMTNNINLDKYFERILFDEDKPLFQEALKAAQQGLFRSAYIMIWLSCAESLKRRFNEASTRGDTKASTIVRSIEKEEKDYKSIDCKLLAEAKSYGFITESEHLSLFTIYKYRCNLWASI